MMSERRNLSAVNWQANPINLHFVLPLIWFYNGIKIETAENKTPSAVEWNGPGAGNLQLIDSWEGSKGGRDSREIFIREESGALVTVSYNDCFYNISSFSESECSPWKHQLLSRLTQAFFFFFNGACNSIIKD